MKKGEKRKIPIYFFRRTMYCHEEDCKYFDEMELYCSKKKVTIRNIPRDGMYCESYKKKIKEDLK